jgi:16S rRNA C967 or C1407 C5-methylase (RsmB/RsmF family)
MWSGVDRLLIDAPCSGTGTLRRNPAAKWKISPERLAECRADQLRILNDYTPRLKPGGRMVYATCSMEPEENEEVMETFLRNHPEFQRLTPDTHLYPHQSDNRRGHRLVRLPWRYYHRRAAGAHLLCRTPRYRADDRAKVAAGGAKVRISLETWHDRLYCKAS